MSFVILLIAAGVVGTWGLRPLGVGANTEGLAYRFLVGLCLLAIPILVVGSASLQAVHAGLYVVAGGGLAHELFGRGTAFARRRETRSQSGPTYGHWPLDRVEQASVAAVLGALGLALVSALAPATSWDACVAHLAVPAQFLREGRFMVFEGNAYSAYPQLLHCLYTAAMLRGGETGAQLLSWTSGALGCMLAYSAGRRLVGADLQTSRRCGLVAAAILATAPVFMDQAGAVSLDLAFSTTALGALNAFLAWRQEKKLGWLAVCGVLAGAGCGIRHTGYVVCVLLFLMVLFTKGSGRFRATACFAALTGLAAMPWLVRSAVLVGNPVYPFLQNVFGSYRLPDQQITSLASHESVRGAGLRDLLLFPWNVVMHPEWYDGWTKSPGPLVLLLGVPGVIVGGKRARLFGGFSAVLGGLLFFFRQYARYLLPAFLPMMAVAAVPACWLRTLRAPVAALLVITFAYGLGLGVAATYFKFPVALGFETRQDYLERRVERYPAFEWMNRNIHPKGLILTLDPRTYFLTEPSYMNPVALRGLVDMPLWRQLDWLQARNIQYVFLPIAYLEESPGFRQSGMLNTINAWRRDRDHFALIHSMHPRRVKGADWETVEIYELRYDR